MRAAARATIAPSELPTTTAGMRFLTSQNEMEVIALKSSLSNEGMFRSGARMRSPSGSSRSRNAATFRPCGDDANPWRYRTFFRPAPPAFRPI